MMKDTMVVDSAVLTAHGDCSVAEIVGATSAQFEG